MRFPAGRRWNHTMVWMNSIRKASYTSAVALVLAAAPLVLGLPAVADPCGPAGLLPVKFCPSSPTPSPPPASPAPSPKRPGGASPSPSGAAPPPAPSQTPSAGQPAQPAPVPATPTSGPKDSTAGDGKPAQPATTSVPTTATPAPGSGTTASPTGDAGQGPGPSAEQPPDAAGAGDPGPDGQIGVAGSLLAVSGLLLGLSAAIGLRRPARP